jgi:putative transposase
MANLTRKAEAAGGRVVEFSTRNTALSQMCQCGIKAKKKLSTRWHRCMCGVSAQRDLYSAYLARHVKENDAGKHYLDIDAAAGEWPAVQLRLTSALTVTSNNYRHKKPASFGL